ncbi:hypothetical protein [Sphingobacterium multivorum]|uniref:Lipocalin-like domain-containing protein n=1 Tax=Sphingobacterium multivorum TaxID=28454 RepID=A0A653XJD9_SPHMU|nr:hypothetical protein [Sphingobacterium multivorum]QQT43500.1 hypothetical protein I6J00_17315 [Sphingobacterium multivorum]SUI98015.1 Uncharacterised protein [Sphingobacterium multivorum]VXC30165.1 conserved hypothetical protein [Sphingobacterium multivorum]HAE66085.1 hypothetical protein [Sphingobacterium sp.]
MKEIYKVLIPAIIVLVLTSCKKDEKIAIDNFIGKWTVANDNPTFVYDGYITYKFNSDMTCVKNIYNALEHRDTSIYRTYVLSNDKTLVTLYDKNKIYTEQYRIKKLNSKEMIWENASPKDGNADKRLVRSTDQ